MQTLIRGGHILTLDPDDRELTGDVLVDGDRIAAIGSLDAPGAQVIDANGMVVLPGLIDTHRHTWQTALRHRGAAWSLPDYLSILLTDLAARYRPDDVYAGTLLGALGAIDAGVTTLVDWSHIQKSPEYTEASVRALTDAGLRAVFAHGWPIGAERRPADLRLARGLLPDDDAPVTLAMAAHGPDFTDAETAAADFHLARELGVPVTAHVAVGRPGPDQRGIATLAAAGLLGPDLTVVHANGASDTDLALLAEHGVSVSISPQIELTMPGLGADVAVRRMLAAGLSPSLSTDSETAASGDLFTQMRIALAVHRSAAPEPPLPAYRVLRMATRDAAAAAGLADRTGSLEVGRAADIILLRATDLNLAPLSHPADAVVLAAHPGNVDTVLVAGTVLKRGGRLVADVERARELAYASVRRLVPDSVRTQPVPAV